MGVRNVLITLGSSGAYLFSDTEEVHIAVSELSIDSQKDETGCGDQTMAALCAAIQDGKPLVEAVKLAVFAGTLQFHKVGVQPVTKDELAAYSTQ